MAIESSGRQAQVGLYDESDRKFETVPGEREMASQPVGPGRSMSNAPGASSSQQLIPQIQSLLHAANWTIGEIDLICLAIGPGSFTGLRIGLVTAKTLCYAKGAKLVGVPTLQAIARQTEARMQLEEGRCVNVVVNAHRQQLFCCRYVAGGNRVGMGEEKVSIVDADDWLSDLDGKEVLTGSGLHRLASRLPDPPVGELAPSDCWSPTTSMLATIGRERASRGEFDDLWTIQPQYCRPSYAQL
ncbi:MAG: tRNA (adenosine(37)-N6)-threonylcarbamoyltransferase complex dimerization subunit type 1 TsaB [Mariniblastus sp.]|nr:tRNA (adenosine(37)-N6)-threonylcarbamoyltransferase complex dimerization subunit type 1 TsaB [Mariniblastus sp.]